MSIDKHGPHCSNVKRKGMPKMHEFELSSTILNEDSNVFRFSGGSREFRGLDPLLLIKFHAKF